MSNYIEELESKLDKQIVCHCFLYGTQLSHLALQNAENQHSKLLQLEIELTTVRDQAFQRQNTIEKHLSSVRAELLDSQAVCRLLSLQE